MRKLSYYVAATLDGYILGPDGQLDFFLFEGDVKEAIVTDYPETMPIQARGPLGLMSTPNKHFDTVIMGRGFYEPGRKLGITSPYPHLKQYVVSRSLVADDPDITVVTDDPAGLVRELKQQAGMDIWLCGGGTVAAALRDEIDELIVKRNPIVIGSGASLFNGPFGPTSFTPAATRDFDSGVNITTYTRK